MRGNGCCALLVIVAAALMPSALSAQGIALEGGGAYLENRDETVLSWGVGFYVPTGERTLAAFNFVQWQEAEGETPIEQCGLDGCIGGGMHLLFRVLGGTTYGWFIGGGLDLYERVSPADAEGEYVRDYPGALSVSTLLARGITENLSLYARGVASARAFDSDLRTAYLHAGIVLRIF